MQDIRRTRQLPLPIGRPERHALEEAGVLSMGDGLPPGALGLDERLHRLEEGNRRIEAQVQRLASNDDVTGIRTRVEAIERNYVGRGAIWAVAITLIAQFLVIIGLGLGLVYELVKH